jgi:adenylate cyclase
MNQYFEAAVGQCIQATDGTVVKYIGDAIFAFWNAPDEQSDHAERACEATLLFRQQPRREMNGQALVTRIGLHNGIADVGNFGSSERVDYTALGENINLASRLEGLNKHLGILTLISGETCRRVHQRYRARALGKFVL